MLCCTVLVCCAEDLVSCCEVVLVDFRGIGVVLRVLEDDLEGLGGSWGSSWMGLEMFWEI